MCVWIYGHERNVLRVPSAPSLCDAQLLGELGQGLLVPSVACFFPDSPINVRNSIRLHPPCPRKARE